ncbi:MAG: dynamin family protein, partial [Desulfobacteraceae bacterium]|nr:dynamin family protein [Desulfobacteraceae bacterium]
MKCEIDLSAAEKAISCLQKYDEDKALQQLEIYRFIEELEEAKSIYHNYKFKIVLLGEFSAGKSSIINAIIGDEILPISYTPTTNLINEVYFGAENYVELKDQPSTRVPLSQAVIAELSSKYDNDRLCTVVSRQDHSLDNFVLFDTPGTNDPSSLSEKIIFDLVGEVDIVLFVLNANQAFRQSEVELLADIVRKKDIGKFFFVLNHADNLDNPYQVKKSFVENLAKLTGQNTAELKNSVFMLSAKNALAGKTASDSGMVKASGISSLEKSIVNYINRNRKELLAEAIQRDVARQLALLYNLCEAFLDKLDGTYLQYQQQIEAVEKEINAFSADIEAEKGALRENIMVLENDFKKDIELAINNVKQIVGDEIDTIPDDKLFNSRYVELRTKKLLEDLIGEAAGRYVEALGELFTSFDQEVLAKFKPHQLQIQTLQKSQKSKHVLNSLAAVGAVSAGTTILPYAGAVLAGGSLVGGLGAISPTLLAIPVFGPFLAAAAGAGAAALPVVGAFVAGAVAVVGKAALWGLKAAKNCAGTIEKKAQRMNYKREVLKALDVVKREMLAGQNISLELDKFILQYIEEKFPEKTILERKMKVINEKYQNVTEKDQGTIELVNQLMEDISLICIH